MDDYCLHCDLPSYGSSHCYWCGDKLVRGRSDIEAGVAKGEADIAAGRVVSQTEAFAHLRTKFDSISEKGLGARTLLAGEPNAFERANVSPSGVQSATGNPPPPPSNSHEASDNEPVKLQWAPFVPNKEIAKAAAEGTKEALDKLKNEQAIFDELQTLLHTNGSRLHAIEREIAQVFLNERARINCPGCKSFAERLIEKLR